MTEPSSNIPERVATLHAMAYNLLSSILAENTIVHARSGLVSVSVMKYPDKEQLRGGRDI